MTTRYVTKLGRSQVLSIPKKGETRHAPGELIREGDKGARQGRPLFVPRGLCLPEELLKSRLYSWGCDWPPFGTPKLDPPSLLAGLAAWTVLIAAQHETGPETG